MGTLAPAAAAAASGPGPQHGAGMALADGGRSTTRCNSSSSAAVAAAAVAAGPLAGPGPDAVLASYGPQRSGAPAARHGARAVALAPVASAPGEVGAGKHSCFGAAEVSADALAVAHARGRQALAASTTGGGGALAAPPQWQSAPGPGHSAHAAVTVSRGTKRALFRPADPAVVARRRLNPKALDASPEPERAPRWEPARMALHDAALGNARGQLYIAH